MIAELTDNERALLAREVAADAHDNEWPLQSTFGNVPRDSFCAGWDAAMDYIRDINRLSSEYQTMRALLNYPNTIGIHDHEARYRDFARALIGINVQTKVQQ